jgi:hypothetical protein
VIKKFVAAAAAAAAVKNKNKIKRFNHSNCLEIEKKIFKK